MTCGIYQIRNKVNGKFYVGSSVNIKSRWSNHRGHLRAGTHHCSYLQRAWSKYGEDAFEFIVLEECCVAKLPAREQHWMSAASYNLAPVAGSTRGLKLTTAQREALRMFAVRAWTEGRHASHSTLMKGNTHLRGCKMSSGTRRKMAEAHRGRKYALSNQERTRRAEHMRNLNKNLPRTNSGRNYARTTHRPR